MLCEQELSRAFGVRMLKQILQMLPDHVPPVHEIFAET